MKLKHLTLILILIIIYLLILLNTRTKVDRQTVETCKYYAPIRTAEYSDTKWKDLDFYQSCIDNIRYASPIGRWE